MAAHGHRHNLTKTHRQKWPDDSHGLDLPTILQHLLMACSAVAHLMSQLTIYFAYAFVTSTHPLGAYGMRIKSCYTVCWLRLFFCI